MPVVDKDLEHYAISKSEPTGALLEEIVKQTYEKTSAPGMLTGPLEGRFLKMMVMAIGAKRVLEIGMFTGYSALSMAEGLPDDGQLITCDINPETIKMGKDFFARSEHGKKITVMEGPALNSISKLEGPFDLAFIDADKTNYLNYYEAILPLMRAGGVILIDNVLWSGRVLNPQDESDFAITKLNDRLATDERVDRVLLTIRDGIFFIVKK